MDFGLAQTAATDAPPKRDGTPLIAGTVGYMAPEQLADGVVTAAVDVYAFGVVLHEMLTGVLPPFRPAIARRGQTALPPPPSRLDTLDIPSRWNALIRRCLERDPAARFKNILEARDAIASGRGSGRRVAFAAAAGAAAIAAVAGVASWKRTPVATAPPAPVAVTSPAPVPPPPPAGPPEASPPPSEADHRPRKVRASTRPQVRLEAGSRQLSEKETPAAPAPARSIADTDDAIDPFRESN
jgi:serine/threonine-protein kinase